MSVSETDEGLHHRRRQKQQQQQQQKQRSHSTVFLPRLVKRDLPYSQSRNRVSVKNSNHHNSGIYRLLVIDWFHVLLRIPVWVSITLLLATWTLVIVLFALLYVKIDETWLEEDCGLGEPGRALQFGTSFAFSLETCTTVGYGLPGSNNGFFNNNCPGVQVAIFAQMTWSMMFNAFLFAFFYSILSKCENRAIQVVFTDKLCIDVRNTNDPSVPPSSLSPPEDDDNNGVFITARCYDMDSAYPIVEAHARMYLVDKEKKMHVMRLNNPNDDLGGVLYTSLPTEISHHVDHHSPLCPQVAKTRLPPFLASSCGLVLRSADSTTANREEIVCPVCGESYGTYDRLRKHVAYNRIIEERDDYPIEGSHLGLSIPDRIQPISLGEVRDYISHNLSEIIVVVEGIDPQVSGTFQALQSYKYDDIVWNGSFEPCLFVENNKFTVDMEKFHHVQQSNREEEEEEDDNDESSENIISV